MFTNHFRLARYLAPIALVACMSVPQAFAQKTKIVNVVSAPLSLSLTADTNTVLACADGGAPQVRLKANAVSPSGYPIKYKWTTDAGTISGEGPVVTWNLAGLTPGYHKASLDILTTASDASCQAFSSVSVLVKPCVAVQPVCPAIEISCPTAVAMDQPLTFTSRYSGGIPANVTPVYNWTVSAGTIISGQGTDTIRVDTAGLAGQTVRASLSMGGYNLECSADCAVTIPLPRPVSKRFDEFPDISRNDEKARLDNFGIEMQNDPTATAYVIVYPGRSSKRGEVQHHASRVVDYLVNSRNLDQNRIKTLVGPARDELYVELWITPQGATPPNP
ncbi:MAG TPA: hypothetical protein VJ306_17470 [Pyrinomonadaceae bacterium]|jgi:hypothetical protein|nr:hypothetical protein [Pyrinomonadaceae bacterium]